MAYEHLKTAALPRALSEVVADVADLIQKEIRLVRAELSAKIATKVKGGVWMAAAGVLGLVAVIELMQAIVHAIASSGLALHWSYLIVAAAVGVMAALAFLKGRADMGEDITPERSIRSIQHDISAAKEHLA